jgi:ribosome-binding protein aMBF1 (putative translation factor)
MTIKDEEMENKEKSYLDEFLSKEKNWFLFEQERLSYRFGDLIEARLEEKNTSQSELAERLKKSPSVISRALNAGSNLTIRTMVEIASAAGLQIVDFEVHAIPDGVSGHV